MKFFVAFMLSALVCADGFAATARGGKQARSATSGGTARTYRSGTAAGTAAPAISVKNVSGESDTATVAATDADATQSVAQEIVVDKREKEREICRSNNIGISNTFVWSSRNANLDDYSTMIEDTQNPENNSCFVKVSMGATDNRIDLSDVKSKYFEMGKNIVCGSWVDEKMLEKQILDAKKTARTWGIVGATVGGAAVGVGAMELFGNKLIGGKVEGQYALEGQELLRSQVLTLKKSNESEYNRIVRAMEDLESVCNDTELWAGAEKPDECNPETNLFIGLREKLDK